MLPRLYNTVSKYHWIETNQEGLCGCKLFLSGYYFDSEIYGWNWTELMNLCGVIINSRVYISAKKINHILRCRQVHSTINSTSIQQTSIRHWVAQDGGGLTLTYIGYNGYDYVRVGFLPCFGLTETVYTLSI